MFPSPSPIRPGYIRPHPYVCFNCVSLRSLQDTLRDCRPQDRHCQSYLPLISPVYFVTFVLTAQFVLVNVVVAVLMKHLEDSNKEALLDEIEEKREKEEANRLSNASVGGDAGPNVDTPAQVRRNCVCAWRGVKVK